MITTLQSAVNLNAGITFELPLNDAGSGIVNTTPLSSLGSGTPTFTRASSAYTRLSSGVWSLIATGQPRSMYSAAGVYLGYWAEGARADVLGTTDAIRRTMADAGWVAGATMTKSLAVGMDGVTDAAACMTGGAVEATNTVLYTTVLASAARTFGPWVRRKTGSGTVRMTDNGGTNWTDITLTTTYQQFQLTRTQANPIVGFQIATNLDAIEIDFNTLEAASFANPTPIPVNVSKEADLLTFPLAGNLDNTVGSAYLEFYSGIGSGVLNNGPLLTDSTSAAFLGLASYTIQTGVRAFDGTNTVNGPVGAQPSSVYKVAVSWGGSAMTVFSGGTAGTPGSFDGSLSISTIGIGGDSGVATPSPFGALRNVRIYNRALSAAQLQVLTT